MRRCQRCHDNEARYINNHGSQLCGICDIGAFKLDRGIPTVSVRISDIPDLLAVIAGVDNPAIDAIVTKSKSS